MKNKDFRQCLKTGKIKEVKHPWQKFLVDKKLLLFQYENGSYNLLAIKDGSTFNELCKYAWENDKEARQEAGYESLNDFIEECKLGNDGFGFHKEEIEIVTE